MDVDTQGRVRGGRADKVTRKLGSRCTYQLSQLRPMVRAHGKGIHAQTRLGVHVRPDPVFTLDRTECSRSAGICRGAEKHASQNPKNNISSAAEISSRFAARLPTPERNSPLGTAAMYCVAMTSSWPSMLNMGFSRWAGDGAVDLGKSGTTTRVFKPPRRSD